MQGRQLKQGGWHGRISQRYIQTYSRELTVRLCNLRPAPKFSSKYSLQASVSKKHRQLDYMYNLIYCTHKWHVKTFFYKELKKPKTIFSISIMRIYMYNYRKETCCQTVYVNVLMSVLIGKPPLWKNCTFSDKRRILYQIHQKFLISKIIPHTIKVKHASNCITLKFFNIL